MVLSRGRVKKYYDWFGARQDTQAFYEDAPVDTLMDHAELEKAADIFEFGCGTGRLAADLLTHRLPEAATYTGCDLSSTMVRIARERLKPFEQRAHVLLSSDTIALPLVDHSIDRVISTYVFDLLTENDMRRVLAESRRVLRPGGRLCLVSLTTGTTILSRLVSSVWSAVFRLRASLVGGCRPIGLSPLFSSNEWTVLYREVVVKFGVPSEVLVAAPVE